MPIYVYGCADRGGCGVRFERLTTFDAPAPGCPECGGEASKVPAGFSLGGQAGTGLSMDRMPQTWRGTYEGNREYTDRLRRQWADRQRLEARYPEIAGDQRPILAHEGRYHDAPLRAGDPAPGAARSGPGAPGAGASGADPATGAAPKSSDGHAGGG